MPPDAASSPPPLPPGESPVGGGGESPAGGGLPSSRNEGSGRGLARRLSLEAAATPSVRVIDTNATIPLRYSILDTPPWGETLLLGVQHFLTFVGSTVSIVFVTVVPAGGSRDDVARVVACLFFVSGIITLVQTVVGDRLPAVQGGTFAYINPVLAVAAIVKARGDWTPAPDGSDPARFVATMREISGACIVAGLIIAAVGASGLLRVCLRFVSPLVVATNIAAVGLTLYGAGVTKMSDCWALSLPMVGALLLFVLYLRRVRVPLWRGRPPTPVFEAVPVVLAIALVWGAAAIATAAGAFRTAPACATRVDLVARAPWVRVPYPGQWGAPTFSVDSSVIVLGGAITAAIQSLGDYYLIARASGAPVPPPAVVERAVVVQGLTSAFAGAFPTGTGSTIYNENAAVLVVSRVGSRRVVQAAACVTMVVALLPKLTAAIASVPQAAVAGLFVVMFSTVAGMGLGQLQFTDMTSPRNVIIAGLCLYLSLSVPALADDPKYAATGGPVATPSPGFNAVANALLRSGSVLALLLGLFLDATVPASPGERGLAAWHARGDARAAWWRVPELAAVYGLPYGVSERVGEARLRAGAWARGAAGAAWGRVRGGCGRPRRRRRAGGKAEEEGRDAAPPA